jgi:hypothetical protein
MKSLLHRHARGLLTMIAALGCAGSLAADTVVVINEFKSDPPGTDTVEFLELFAYDAETGVGVPHLALDGYVVVFFNGNAAGNPAYAVTPLGGTATASIKLDGRVTNHAGFFLIGSPAVAGADLELTTGSSGWFQNGADGVGVYRNPTVDFTTGTGATAAELVDAIVYGTEDPDDFDLLETLTPGGIQINEPPNSVNALARIPDGGPPFASALFAPQTPTPGSLNRPEATLVLSLTPPSLVEGATGEGTVTRSGSTAAAVTVRFATSDPGEVTVPSTVELAAGAASAVVPVWAVDDLWPDGPQSVSITATAPGYVPAALTVTVEDNGDAPQPLVINEIFATGIGDANQDGANRTNQDRFNDEFVEIVNRGLEAADLSGFQLFTSSIASVRHTFPAGTVLPPGAALVVFGGGSPALGITPAFGTAWIQTANAAALGLYLLEPSARLSLLDTAGREVAGFEYDHQSAASDSVTLSPDVTGTPAQHASLGEGSVFYSPGTRTDGTPFLALSAELDPGMAPSRVAENAGRAAATLTIRRTAPFTSPLVVTVVSSDPTEAVPSAATVTIIAGEAAASLPVTAVDDTAQDGAQMVTFTCIAAGHLNGTTTLEVDDDGLDAPPIGVFINEIDTDQPGPDTAEFIELYVGEAAARALDGFVVVLFNGAQAANGAYAVIDLAGHSTDSRGFFVLGGATVPNVGLVLPDSSIQNGADAVAVYRAPADAFRTGANPTPPSLDALVDVVVYGNGSGEDFDLVSAFQSFGDPPAPALVQHNEGEPNNTTALARRPDATSGFGAFTVQAPTPGAPNEPGSTVPPTIAIALEGTHVVVTFTGILEQSPSLLEGSFAPVAGATSPHRLPLPPTGALYFRAVSP